MKFCLDLEEIWTRSIERHLGVQVADMRQYKAVLVIPALYKRSLVKHFVSLLLLKYANISRAQLFGMFYLTLFQYWIRRLLRGPGSCGRHLRVRTGCCLCGGCW